MGRGGRNVTQRSRIVPVVPHVAIFYSTGVEHCSPVRYCLRFRLDFPKDNWLVLGVPMNEAVPEAPSSVESMAKQGCEKLGLDAFDALVEDIERGEGSEVTTFDDNTILYEYLDEAVVVHNVLGVRYVLFDSMVTQKIENKLDSYR